MWEGPIGLSSARPNSYRSDAPTRGRLSVPFRQCPIKGLIRTGVSDKVLGPLIIPRYRGSNPPFECPIRFSAKCAITLVGLISSSRKSAGNRRR